MKSTLKDLTQPCCEDCWAKKCPGVVPIRLDKSMREEELCIFCRRLTWAGIYVSLSGEK